MISLATFSTSIRVSPEAGEATLLTSAKGSFSALLARHGPELVGQASENPSVEGADVGMGSSTSAMALAAALPGIALPVAAEGGKELPVALSVAGEEGETETDSEVEIDVEAAEALSAIVIMPQAALPVVAMSGEPGEPVETSSTAPARPVTPRPAPPAQVPMQSDGKTLATASERANGSPRETAVALHVGPAAGAPAATSAADDTATGGDAGEAPAQRRDMTLTAVARPNQPEALRQPEQAAPAAPAQPAAISAAPASEASGQTPRIDTLQELTRIVDRLAAAREALAPAAEALAIEHAEFGELSLRFDQRRDGGLSVQLSASNPEAHRAVAQAVGAQSFQTAADDRSGAGQPQSQPQSSASRGSADREGTSGNGSAARHDQSTPQQQRRAAEQQPGAGKPRTGIFA